MTITGENSQTTQVVARKDTWFVKEPRISIEGVIIPTIDSDEAFK